MHVLQRGQGGGEGSHRSLFDTPDNKRKEKKNRTEQNRQNNITSGDMFMVVGVTFSSLDFSNLNNEMKCFSINLALGFHVTSAMFHTMCIQDTFTHSERTEGD